MAKKKSAKAKSKPKAKAKPVRVHRAVDGSTKKVRKYTRAKSPRSQTLPGMEQVRHTKLDRICEGISEVREVMNEQRTLEGEKCRAALVYMHDNTITTYRYAGVELVRVPGEEKLRVRTSKEKATLETEEDTGSGQDAAEIAIALTPDDERLAELSDDAE